MLLYMPQNVPQNTNIFWGELQQRWYTQDWLLSFQKSMKITLTVLQAQLLSCSNNVLA